jgi:hypothetical protein
MHYELSDYEWTAIRPMLPNKPRGVRRVNDCRVLNGIFWSCVQVHHGGTCQLLADRGYDADWSPMFGCIQTINADRPVHRKQFRLRLPMSLPNRLSQRLWLHRCLNRRQRFATDLGLKTPQEALETKISRLSQAQCHD